MLRSRLRTYDLVVNRDAMDRRSGRGLSWCVGIGLAGLTALSACSSTALLPSPAASAPAEHATSTSEASSTSEPAASAPAGAIMVELAGPPPHFVPADLMAAAGDLVFFLHNRSPGTHTLAIGRELHKALATSSNVPKGEAAVFTVHGLRAGDYLIWCTIDGHAGEGMVGTLTLK